MKTIFDDIAGEYNQQRQMMAAGEERCWSIIGDYLKIRGCRPRLGLDLGTGGGYFSRIFLELFPDLTIIGLDASPAMLAAARGYWSSYEGRVGTRYYRAIACGGDIRRLPFHDGTFNLIVSSLTVHHLNNRDKKKLMHAARRLLKPEGVCVIWDKFRESGPVESGYHAIWKMRMQGRGMTAEQIREIERRRALDDPAYLDRFMRMMTRAGFIQVNNPYKDLGLALVVGERGKI